MDAAPIYGELLFFKDTHTKMAFCGALKTGRIRAYIYG